MLDKPLMRLNFMKNGRVPRQLSFSNGQQYPIGFVKYNWDPMARNMTSAIGATPLSHAHD
eukprot:4494229-Prymnesium_polylepis.1